MKEKINILVPIRYPVGGIRTYLKYTYGKLDPEKYSFTIIGPLIDWLERIRNDLSRYEIDISCSFKKESTLSLSSAVIRSLAKKKIHIIHSQGYTAGMMSSIINMGFFLPHVVTLHRIFGYDQFSRVFWKNNVALKKRMIEFVLKRADIIQCVSNDAQNNLLEYFPGFLKTPNKLRMIRNGIKVQDFDNHAGSEVETFLKEPDIFYIGYFGRYMPEKGFTHLIDLMEILAHKFRMENIRILSVGGFGGFIREYKKEIKKRGLESYFQFLGFFQNVEPVLRNIDLLIIPSFCEACGLISMEGLVCGTPTLGYSCLGLREVLDGTPARLVSVGDFHGLAEKVVAIKEQYARVKQEFIEYIPEAKLRYDSSETARQLDQVFNKLVNHNNSKK